MYRFILSIWDLVKSLTLWVIRTVDKAFIQCAKVLEAIAKRFKK